MSVCDACAIFQANILGCIFRSLFAFGCSCSSSCYQLDTPAIHFTSLEVPRFRIRKKICWILISLHFVYMRLRYDKIFLNLSFIWQNDRITEYQRTIYSFRNISNMCVYICMMALVFPHVMCVISHVFSHFHIRLPYIGSIWSHAIYFLAIFHSLPINITWPYKIVAGTQYDGCVFPTRNSTWNVAIRAEWFSIRRQVERKTKWIEKTLDTEQQLKS